MPRNDARDPSGSRTAKPTHPFRVAAASFIGTTIEWYDFYIFGIASALIFSSHFFPNLDPLAGTLASMSTLAVAFVARPIGGVVFGHFGDRVGRKSILIYSIVVMGLSTFAIGLMPTYATLGIWAAVLLVAMRFAQGFAVGGEWGGAVLMALEHAPPGRRAFFASWPQCGVPFGMVLSSGAFFLVQLLPADAFQSWGWRLPFFASFALVLVGLYVRLSVTETPEFRQVAMRNEQAAVPLLELFRTALPRVLVGIFSVAASNAIFWTVSGYLLSYGVTIGIDKGTFFLAVIVGGVLEALAIPFVAASADRFGRNRIMIAGAVVVGLIAFPVFWLLNTKATWGVYASVILALSVAHSMSYAVVSSFLAELFEPRLRYTGSAVTYQLGGIVTSAPIPVLATYLYQRTGSTNGISLLLVFAALMTIAAVLAHLAFRAADRPQGVAAADPVLNL